MPFIALLMAAVVGAAVWYWRIKTLREAGGEIIDSLERMRGAYNRRQFRKKVEASPLAAIREPSIAAVAFFLCLANEKPRHKDEAVALIRQRMGHIIKPGDMNEVLVFGEWAIRNVVNPEDVVRRFRDLWRQMLTPEERQELISIAHTVSNVADGPDEAQKTALDALNRALDG